MSVDYERIKIYGASDDLCEVEGNIEGCDEYDDFTIPTFKFEVAGLWIVVEYSSNGSGCWMIGVAPIDESDYAEGVKAKNVEIGFSDYSTVLYLDFPHDSVIRKVD